MEYVRRKHLDHVKEAGKECESGVFDHVFFFGTQKEMNWLRC